jgi:ribosomal protein L11 methyltransferase
MAWIELCMNATDEGLDWICTSLATQSAGQAAPPEIQISNLEALEAGSEAGSNWQFQVQIYLEQSAGQPQLDPLQAALRPLHRTGLISNPETYLTDQKPAARPFQRQIGRFVLAPTQPLAPDQIPLYLAPSPAFGHGSHPATRLATLDLGTGTGILSLAMAKLGATVLALDNELAAVQSAEATVRLNQMAAQVTVRLGSLGQGSELGHWMSGELSPTPALWPVAQFDLIAANILARIHIALAPDYQTALRPNGILITAGFTQEFETEIQAALAEAGFEPLETLRLNDWVALAHRLC